MPVQQWGQRFLLLLSQERSRAACALPLTVCVHAQLLFFFGVFFSFPRDDFVPNKKICFLTCFGNV